MYTFFRLAKTIQATVFATALIFSSIAMAGGDYGEILITEFNLKSKNGAEFVLSAKILKERKELQVWEKCDEITIRGDYDSLRWENYDRPMSKTTHAQGIDYLSKSSTSSEPIYFGVMGAGLKELGACIFESKGLFVQATRGHVIVFSVHYPI